jgi:hypothetical protein
MAKALGQEPVHVPHWMQALTIFRMGASESITGAGAVSGFCWLFNFSKEFMQPPFSIFNPKPFIEMQNQ